MSVFDHTQFLIDGKKYEVYPGNLVCVYKEYPYKDVRPEDRMKWMEKARMRQIRIYCISEDVFIKTTKDLPGEGDGWDESVAEIFNTGSDQQTEVIDRKTAVKLLNSHGENVIEDNYKLVFPEYGNR